jgi:hypothetical protein
MPILLPKRFEWREPRAFRRVMNIEAQAQTKWWYRPMIGLGCGGAMLLLWVRAGTDRRAPFPRGSSRRRRSRSPRALPRRPRSASRDSQRRPAGSAVDRGRPGEIRRAAPPYPILLTWSAGSDSTCGCLTPREGKLQYKMRFVLYLRFKASLRAASLIVGRHG